MNKLIFIKAIKTLSAVAAITSCMAIILNSALS
jgi:hypothetical protein